MVVVEEEEEEEEEEENDWEGMAPAPLLAPLLVPSQPGPPLAGLALPKYFSSEPDPLPLADDEAAAAAHASVGGVHGACTPVPCLRASR